MMPPAVSLLCYNVRTKDQVKSLENCKNADSWIVGTGLVGGGHEDSDKCINV